MDFRILIAPACLALLGACTTYPAQTASNTQVDAAVVADSETAETTQTAATEETNEVDESRVICKRKQVTGSRFAKNICMTWGEWKDMEERSKDYITNHQRRMTQQGNPQGGE